MVFSIDALQGPELLRETQRNRLTAFLDPEFDTQGVSYNLQQSQIAIGSGGLTGQGWRQGSQTNLNLVPHQESDFIFTALGEEFGFLGAGALLLAYAYMIFRMWAAARNSRDTFGMLICIGVLSMFLFQVFENVGMTMGIYADYWDSSASDEPRRVVGDHDFYSGRAGNKRGRAPVFALVTREQPPHQA